MVLSACDCRYCCWASSPASAERCDGTVRSWCSHAILQQHRSRPRACKPALTARQRHHVRLQAVPSWLFALYHCSGYTGSGSRAGSGHWQVGRERREQQRSGSCKLGKLRSSGDNLRQRRGRNAPWAKGGGGARCAAAWVSHRRTGKTVLCAPQLPAATKMGAPAAGKRCVPCNVCLRSCSTFAAVPSKKKKAVRLKTCHLPSASTRHPPGPSRVSWPAMAAKSRLRPAEPLSSASCVG